MRIIVAIALVFIFAGCSSIKVVKFDAAKPAGLPFYLSKQMVKVSKIKYDFKKIADLGAEPFYTINTVERELVMVQDMNAAYSINQSRSFLGESAFKIERSSSSSTSASNCDIAKVETSNKEGVTEFLKGLIEGAKTVTEALKTAPAGGAAPPGLVTTDEATYFNTLAGSGIIVFKSVVEIKFEELCPN